MRNCSTCCTRTKTFDFGIPATRPDEKLEFVEHVLGVLIENRYGVDNPYTRLGERTVAIGHSQMFANVTLLNAAEIEAHLELPLASANGTWLQGRAGFSPKSAWAKAREAFNRRLKPTAILVDSASSPLLQPTSIARGSPICLGRSSSRLPLRT